MEEKFHNTPDGKKLIIEEIPDTNKARVFIRGNTKRVEIGTLDRNKREFRVYRKKSLHEHHRTQTYGFSHFLLENSTHIDKVRVLEDDEGVNNEYLIPRNTILELGTIMKFIGETQIFFPISLMRQFYKI